MPRTIFVTTALPYANGSFHIGHIMEYIQADIWVRSMRMSGHTVHFVGADDAHGAPLMLKAESEGITPQALVARYASERPHYLHEIGRASCRERVCEYVSISGVAGSLKKKT